MIDEIRLRQKQQRDKLMELGSKWAQGVINFGWVVGMGGNADLEFAQAKQAFEEFRDYVEHMHDIQPVLPNTLEALEFFKKGIENVVPMPIRSTPYPEGMKNGYLKLMEDSRSEKYSLMAPCNRLRNEPCRFMRGHSGECET